MIQLPLWLPGYEPRWKTLLPTAPPLLCIHCCHRHVFTMPLPNNGHIQNATSYIVACLFVAADICLLHHYLAVVVSIHSTVLAFSCHNIFLEPTYSTITSPKYKQCWLLRSGQIYRCKFYKLVPSV
jgi:hypothetical protein